MRTVTAIRWFLYVLAARWTAEANINVEGVEGGEVTFQCKHKLASTYDKYFCKDPCKTALITVKYRTTAQLGKITLLDWGNGTFTVNINQLQLSDSGKYWCGVDRPGFDTFTAVHLTVEKDVATVPPDVIPTQSRTKIFTSTQLIPEMDTSEPTNISIISNCTNRGEEHFSTSTVLYTTIGVVTMLTILVFATSFRKCREISEAQPQVCSNSGCCRSAEGREEVDCEVQSIKNSPEGACCAQQPKLDPSTSALTAADTIPSHIYENVCFIRGNTDSSASGASVQNDSDIASRTYFKLFPSTVSEQTKDGFARTYTQKPTESCASHGSDTDSIPCHDSSESKSRELWFGLDLSGTI